MNLKDKEIQTLKDIIKNINNKYNIVMPTTTTNDDYKDRDNK